MERRGVSGGHLEYWPTQSGRRPVNRTGHSLTDPHHHTLIYNGVITSQQNGLRIPSAAVASKRSRINEIFGNILPTATVKSHLCCLRWNCVHARVAYYSLRRLSDLYHCMIYKSDRNVQTVRPNRASQTWRPQHSEKQFSWFFCTLFLHHCPSLHHRKASLNIHILLTMAAIINKCSAVAEMGDRLATIDIGLKLGGCAPLGRRSWVPI